MMAKKLDTKPLQPTGGRNTSETLDPVAVLGHVT